MAPNSSGSDEDQIRAQVECFRRGFQDKDVDLIMSVFAPEIVSFDLVPPLVCTGADGLRDHWRTTFGSYDGPIVCEIRDLSMAVADDLAFTRSVNFTGGDLKIGRRNEVWLRWTACWRRRDDQWLIVHEHVSVPMNPATGAALVDLTP